MAIITLHSKPRDRTLLLKLSHSRPKKRKLRPTLLKRSHSSLISWIPIGKTLINLGLAFLTLLWAAPAAAVHDPSIPWFTIETPHFVIHFHEGLSEMAKESAEYAESAHETLAPLLNWSPGNKTHMVLSDRGDSANGSARVIPYNLIQLLGATPTTRSTLNDHEGWLRNLIYHEYTHILHIDTMSGLPAWINRIVGKSVAPNGALPKWYIEGLATYFESQHTPGGRVRSNIYRMYLRTASLSGTFFPIDRLSGTPIDWPRGRSPYLYGSFFLAFLAENYGETSFAEFNHHYGQRIIPFGINTVAKRVYGEDFPTLYRQWTSEMAGKALWEAIKIRLKGPLSDVEQLSDGGFESNSLRARPLHPNQLSYFRSNEYELSMFVLHDTETGEETELFEHLGGGRHSWSPDGRWIVFSEGDPDRGGTYFNELFRYDVESGLKEHLTHQQRAREPAISPDGKSVVFVSARSGTADLKLLDLESGALTLLHKGSGDEMVAAPSFHPDGQRLVVSRFHGSTHPQRNIYLFDLNTHAWTPLTNDHAIDIEPTFDAAGQHVLFSSDRSGVYNIYAASLLDGKVRQLTRTLGGHFSPQLHPNGKDLLLTTFGAKGYDVGRVLLPKGLPLKTPPAEEAYLRPLIEHPTPSLELKSKPYRPWRYLWPRTWLPSLDGIATTNQLSFLFGAADPSGIHAWLASATKDLSKGNTNLFLSYTYSRLPVDLQATISRRVGTPGFRVESNNTNYQEEQVDASLRLILPIAEQDQGQFLSLSFNYVYRGLADLISPKHSPLDRHPLYPNIGLFNRLSLGWSYSRVDSHPRSISPESGFRFGLSLSGGGPEIGSDNRILRASYSSSLYLPIPYLKYNVLALRFAGGYGWGDSRRRSIFSIGGLPEQDLLVALLNQLPLGGASLRGYPAGVSYGDHFQLLNIEYRFPIYEIERGAYTLPFYLGRLSGALLLDHGGAYFGRIDLDEMRLGLGAELRMNATISYYLPVTLKLGYAHGFDKDGFDHAYLVYGSQF